MTQEKSTAEKRKTEYRQREEEGRELLVNSFGCKLGLSDNQVTVKKDGRTTIKRRADMLSRITISSNGVSLSSNLIFFCLDNGITIDFFNNGGRHAGSVLSAKYMEGTLWSRQSQCSTEQRMELASKFLEAKVRNQFSLVKYFHKYHKLNHEALAERYETFAALADELHSFLRTTDVGEANFMTSLLAYESQGAVKYWAYIRELLSDDKVAFERREHNGATDLVNCMLNYGYAMLYSRVWQALLAAKLNPFDSIIHVRQDNKPTFAYDVVEMFRSQVVDRVVIKLIQKQTDLSVADGLLTEETKKALAAEILQRLNRREKYRAERLSMEQIIRRQAKEIADFIDTKEPYKPYIAKW